MRLSHCEYASIKIDNINHGLVYSRKKSDYLSRIVSIKDSHRYSSSMSYKKSCANSRKNLECCIKNRHSTSSVCSNNVYKNTFNLHYLICTSCEYSIFERNVISFNWSYTSCIRKFYIAPVYPGSDENVSAEDTFKLISPAHMVNVPLLGQYPPSCSNSYWRIVIYYESSSSNNIK